MPILEPQTEKTPPSMATELQALRDEIRLKIHLAGMDAKAEWSALEASILHIEDEIRGAGARITKATRERVLEAQKKLRDFKKSKLPSVEDVMSAQVFACCADDPLHRAAHIMWQHDCGAVPVVDAEGEVLAMITDRDLCMAAYTRNINLSQATVSSAMSSAMYACGPDDSLVEAARIMGERQVRRLPVVSRGKLVGIVSLADLVRGGIDERVLMETLASICRHRPAALSAQ